MKRTRTWAVAVAWMVVGLVVAGVAAASEAETELNELMVRQVELSLKVHEQQSRLDGCLNDASLTSPEIEAVRRQLDALRQELAVAGDSEKAEARREAVRREMVCTQELLRVKMQVLPAVRAQVERIEADRRTLKEAGQRIRELRDATAK